MDRHRWIVIGSALALSSAWGTACDGTESPSVSNDDGGAGAGAGAGLDATASDGRPSSDGNGDSSPGTDAGPLDAGYVDGGPLTPPRPIAPLSTATVSKPTPTLTWALPAGVDGAEVEVCADRRCSSVELSFVASGASAPVSTALSAGVHFWRLRAKAGNAIGSTTSPVWELVVGHRTATHDSSWGAFPDFDGDGFADFAIGTDNSRAATIMRGAAIGIDDTSPRTVLVPSALPANRFEFVANAGDVDGDGYVDLAVGQTCFDAPPCAVGSTAVFIYKGGPNGGSIPPGVTDGGTVAAAISFTLLSPDGDDTQFARVVKGVGDVNGDGYADLLVGSPISPSGGRAFVYLGSATGLSSAHKIQLDGGGSALFGIGGAGPGDLDGDGYADVVVSSQTALFLFRGSAAGPANATRGTFTLPASIGSATLYQGVSANAGDLDGDGFPDIALGAYNASADAGAQGQVYIYRGAASVPDLLISDATLNGPSVGGYFGFATAISGDLDGDGFDDLVVGSPSNAYGSGGVGSAHVFPGSATGVADASRIALEDPSGGGGFGIIVAGGGSIQGTGRQTALVASYLGDYVRVYALGTDRSVTSRRLSAKPAGRWNYPAGLE